MAFTITSKFGDTIGGGRFHSAIATGAGAINETLIAGASTGATIGLNCNITEVRLHLSAAGATAEKFTAQLDSGEGTVFDLLSVSQDMNGETDFHRIYDGRGMILDSSDKVDFAYPNTDARTWGLKIIYEELR